MMDINIILGLHELAMNDAENRRERTTIQAMGKAAFSQYPRSGGMGHTVTDGRWRYTEWRNKAGRLTACELYDHAKSALATANLINDPEYADVAIKMETLLEAGPDAARPE